MTAWKTACLLLSLLIGCQVAAQDIFDADIRPADAAPAKYMHLLKGKRVGLIINQTSRVGDSLLLDMALARGVNVTKIFVPEHGFRGSADAGANIESYTDSATQIPVISLYGKHKKPTKEDLADVDVMVYDLQDVGVRFYTYISTLQYCMEACATEGKQIMILDRPDPNGFYVDGPVLDKECASFVGMQPIPVVYGMTAGEYAMMLKGEHWFDGADNLNLKVIPCTNYDHSKKYKLPVAPSPNLRTMTAVYAYPSLCLFEGTKVSVGRGTDKPFQQYGSPGMKGKYSYSFVPHTLPGASKPMYEHETCYGKLIADDPKEALKVTGGRMEISWLIDAYSNYDKPDSFFNSFFTKLAGNKLLAQQVKQGMTEKDIRRSWQKELSAFCKIRRKYLLYEDGRKR